MSDLQEITERTTANFPRDTGIKEVRNLFNYLAKNSLEINYEFLFGGNVKKVGSNIINEELISKISGHITDQKTYATNGFYCELRPEEKEDQYIIKIKSLKFDPIIDYPIKQHRPEIVNLWDKVRDLTDQYFQKNKE